jgi:hypothetical protein
MHSLFDRGTVQEEVYKNVLKTLNAASPETFGFDPNEYTIYMLDAGCKFIVEAEADCPCIYVVSYQTPTYFDLGMIIAGDHVLIAFSLKTSPDQQLRHLGDVKFMGAENEEILMHSMSGTFVIGQHHPVLLTGYSDTPLLINFAAHRPVVLVVDHTKHIVDVVSIPLDEDIYLLVLRDCLLW